MTIRELWEKLAVIRERAIEGGAERFVGDMPVRVKTNDHEREVGYVVIDGDHLVLGAKQ